MLRSFSEAWKHMGVDLWERIFVFFPPHTPNMYVNVADHTWLPRRQTLITNPLVPAPMTRCTPSIRSTQTHTHTELYSPPCHQLEVTGLLAPPTQVCSGQVPAQVVIALPRPPARRRNSNTGTPVSCVNHLLFVALIKEIHSVRSTVAVYSRFIHMLIKKNKKKTYKIHQEYKMKLCDQQNI